MREGVLRRPEGVGGGLVLALLLVGGCTAADLPPAADGSSPASEDFSWGAERVCAAPATGWSRAEELGEERGLDRPLTGMFDGDVWEGTASVAMADLDDDGDLDLAIGPIVGLPHLYLNDGEGWFEPGPELEAEGDGMDGSALLAAVDLDDDGRPELAAAGRRLLVWDEPLAEPRAEQAVELPAGAHYAAIAVGDADVDGDLDLYLTTFRMGYEGPAPAGLLLLNDDGAFGRTHRLEGTHGGVNSQAALFTDRDHDGRADLLVLDGDNALQGQRTAFFHNRSEQPGELRLEDDGPEVGADLTVAAMGVDSIDRNGDGELDYCFTDLGPTRCLESMGGGLYVDTTAATGLWPEEIPYPGLTPYDCIGWDFSFVDLDNDGWEDAVQTGAPDHGSQLPPELRRWPDLAWRGTPDGDFVEVTDELGFGHTDAHYGLAAGDLDGDGFLDLVVVGPGVRPLLHSFTCGVESWLELELVGPPGNREGIGTVAKVGDSRRTQVRELHGTRVHGQGPSRFHFGLGEDAAAEIVVVHWPDGHVSKAEQVPGRRVVTVTHPEAR